MNTSMGTKRRAEQSSSRVAIAMVRPRIVAPTRTRSPGDVFEEVFMTTVTRLGEAVNLHVERTTETIETIWAPGTF